MSGERWTRDQIKAQTNDTCVVHVLDSGCDGEPYSFVTRRDGRYFIEGQNGVFYEQTPDQVIEKGNRFREELAKNPSLITSKQRRFHEERVRRSRSSR